MEGSGKTFDKALATRGGGDEGAETWDFDPNTGGHMGEDNKPCDAKYQKWFADCLVKSQLKLNAPMAEPCKAKFRDLAENCVFGPIKS